MQHTVSWSEVDSIMDLLVRRLNGRQINVIVGIARAGLVPATILSHRLGVRDFVVMDVQRTRSDDIDADKLRPVCRSLMNDDLLDGRHALLVDDIVGEGLTMSFGRTLLRERCATVTTAALVVNLANLHRTNWDDVVDHVGCVVHGWVVFPWERGQLAGAEGGCLA